MALVVNLVGLVALLGVEGLGDKNSRVMARRERGPRRKKQKNCGALIWSHELP